MVDILKPVGRTWSCSRARESVFADNCGFIFGYIVNLTTVSDRIFQSPDPRLSIDESGGPNQSSYDFINAASRPRSTWSLGCRSF
jgi:hypothetical protein